MCGTERWIEKEIFLSGRYGTVRRDETTIEGTRTTTMTTTTMTMNAMTMFRAMKATREGSARRRGRESTPMMTTGRQRILIRANANDDAERGGETVRTSRRGLVTLVMSAPTILAARSASAWPWDALTGTPSAGGGGAEASFASLRRDVEKLMRKDPDFGPTMVRLAWHSCGTYDRISKTGGSGGGTIRFEEELAHGGNAGLAAAVDRLAPVKRKHDDISWADLIAYVGVVAIEEMGGPKLKFSYGRVDEIDPAAVTPDGRLPDADKGDGPGRKTRDGLRDVFYRMGFDDQEIVALSGAHALGRCHANASGYVGPWTSTPTSFNNSYFVLLRGLKWEPNDEASKFQYKDPSGQLMMLPSDIALIEDPKFKRYVDAYAKSQDEFFADFAAAFEKLETLGTSGLTELAA